MWSQKSYQLSHTNINVTRRNRYFSFWFLLFNITSTSAKICLYINCFSCTWQVFCWGSVCVSEYIHLAQQHHLHLCSANRSRPKHRNFSVRLTSGRDNQVVTWVHWQLVVQDSPTEATYFYFAFFRVKGDTSVWAVHTTRKGDAHLLPAETRTKPRRPCRCHWKLRRGVTDMGHCSILSPSPLLAWDLCILAERSSRKLLSYPGLPPPHPVPSLLAH